MSFRGKSRPSSESVEEIGGVQCLLLLVRVLVQSVHCRFESDLRFGGPKIKSGLLMVRGSCPFVVTNIVSYVIIFVNWLSLSSRYDQTVKENVYSKGSRNYNKTNMSIYLTPSLFIGKGLVRQTCVMSVLRSTSAILGFRGLKKK